MLNLDTKSTKVSSVTDDEIDEEASPKGQETSGFKPIPPTEAFRTVLQQEHAGSDSVSNRKSKKFSPAEDVESPSDRVEPEDNDYVNGLEAHHHPHSLARSRKATHKYEPTVNYLPADKEKPLLHQPKSNIEPLDIVKGRYVDPVVQLHFSRPPAELESIYRFPSYNPLYIPGGDAALQLFQLQHQLYAQHWLHPIQGCPPKDVRPSSPPRRSPSKEAPTYFPTHVDPNQSSAVVPIH